jgi:inorganic pyrophosphatase
MLKMIDEAGEDAKLLAVPVDKLTKLYSHVKTLDDLPPSLLQQVSHFFEHYKDLEPGKFVKVEGWGDLAAAQQEIMAGVANYQSAKDKPAY